ncbi:hypothetical protein Tco_0656300 [Tanacetum coccineum]|uniref:MAK10-like protein n=1 Tax=Tanacetum coccineum TaxID=301880 RepID=A0ABQ4X9M7_9ASTR
MENLYPKHGLISRTYYKRRTIDQSAGGKLRDLNAEESRALLEDLALYENESWNDPKDFAKPVKAIALPQDVPSTSDHRLIKIKNQVQRLMEAHLALTQLTQVNKITTSCEICSGPHDTQYCMEDPEQAFVEYASSRTDEAGGKWYTFKPKQNNLGDTYNLSWRSHPNLRWRQPQNSQNNFSNPPNRFQPNGSFQNRSFNNNPQPFNNQSNLEGLVSNFMASQDARLSKFKADFKQQQSKMTNKIDTVLKAITDRIAGALPSDTVKNSKLNTSLILSAHFYPTIDPQCSSHPSNSINAIKAHFKEATISQTSLRSPKIETEPPQPEEPEPTLEDEFQDVHLNLPVLEEAPYWTILGKRESYKPRPLSDGIGARILYYARKDFSDCHLPEEWEIARDVELNPFKDTLVFRRMEGSANSQRYPDFCYNNVMEESLSEACLSPQPQALGTTLRFRVKTHGQDYLKKNGKIWKYPLFKQREEINDRMTKMFGLLKELTNSRAPEKVLIREEAKFPVTKNVNSVSLARGEEERSDKTNETLDNTVKPTVTEMEIPMMETEKSNETKNKLIKKAERKLLGTILGPQNPIVLPSIHVLIK